MGIIFDKHRDQRLNQYLTDKKDYFKDNPSLLGIGVTDFHDNDRIRFDIPRAFKYISYDKGYELNLSGFAGSEPAYVRARETISMISKRFLEYEYVFQWHGAKYTCHGNNKDKPEKYTLRFEIHNRADAEPHVHVIHKFPKIKGKRITGFEEFIDWVIENFYNEQREFIAKYPWER
jgi:hypothetical protein